MRDPNSADSNAQAPEGHPDAQVRVDLTNRRTGVQAPVYTTPLPASAKRLEPAPVTDAEVEARAEADAYLKARMDELDAREAELAAGEAALAADLAKAKAEPIAVTGDGVVIDPAAPSIVADAVSPALSGESVSPALVAQDATAHEDKSSEQEGGHDSADHE